MKYFFSAVLASLLLSTYNAQAENSSDHHLKSVKIAAQPGVCFGMFQQLCMLVKKGRDSKFSNFYGRINGFTYEWGYRYQLQVEEIPVKNPPADASSIRTNLMAVISKMEDKTGTPYSFQRVQMMAGTVTEKNGEYRFFDKSFSCNARTRCKKLLALQHSNRMVDLTFNYQGNSNVQLVKWTVH